MGATSEQFVSEIDAAKAQVDAAIAGLTDEQASRREIDGWSVKDHLTHMTFWHEMRFFELSRVARGGHFVFPEIGDTVADDLNQLFADNRRSLSLEQVISDLDFVRGLISEAVSTCPHDRLDLNVYGEIGPHGAGHDSEHADYILQWRQKEGI